MLNPPRAVLAGFSLTAFARLPDILLDRSKAESLWYASLISQWDRYHREYTQGPPETAYSGSKTATDLYDLAFQEAVVTPISQDRARPRLSTRFAIQLLTLCFVLFAARGVWAQANAGVTGTVTDPSGAVVPDANVTITNEGTSVSNKAITSSSGTYTVTGLIPGAYTLTVEKSGFKKAVQNHVNVEVSTTSTINFSMTTGAATETVEVEASSIALNTTAPQLGSTIEPAVVKALPTQVSGRGRQIDQLQFLAPGITGDTFSHRIGGGVDFEQEIVYNGVPAPQPETEGYTTNFNPPYEMVQEFRVERSTFSAQFGLGQGALTYQMASGTNSYHGDLFEINRNSLFDSVGYFNGPYWGGTNKVSDRSREQLRLHCRRTDFDSKTVQRERPDLRSLQPGVVQAEQRKHRFQHGSYCTAEDRQF